MGTWWNKNTKSQFLYPNDQWHASVQPLNMIFTTFLFLQTSQWGVFFQFATRWTIHTSLLALQQDAQLATCSLASSLTSDLAILTFCSFLPSLPPRQGGYVFNSTGSFVCLLVC